MSTLRLKTTQLGTHNYAGKKEEAKLLTCCHEVALSSIYFFSARLPSPVIGQFPLLLTLLHTTQIRYVITLNVITSRVQLRILLFSRKFSENTGQ